LADLAKKHGFKLWNEETFPPPQSVPNDPQLCGYGATGDDAVADLAKVSGIRLWNEESA
jgi:hypothetical protein